MANKTYQLDKDSSGEIPVSQVENETGDDSISIKGRNNASFVEEIDSNGNNMNDGSGNKNVALQTAIPSGSNIIGQVKMTDGTNALAINTNGDIQMVPVDSNGNSLIDADGNLKVAQYGSNAEIYTGTASDVANGSRLDLKINAAVKRAILFINSSSTTVDVNLQWVNSGSVSGTVNIGTANGSSVEDVLVIDEQYLASLWDGGTSSFLRIRIENNSGGNISTLVGRCVTVV